MSTRSSLRVQAEVDQLAALRQFVEDRARALGVEQSAVYDLVLAANEIATNIVVHGYRGQPGEIDVELRPVDDAIEICLRDQAPPFDPTGAPTPDLTLPLHRRPRGGCGIHVTRQLMDLMIYRAPPQGGNELTLVKRGIVGQHAQE